MCDQHRRQFMGSLAKGGLLLTPLAAALSGCRDDGKWPEGMKSIIWDRDTCVRCNMAISDRRFAAELRGGPKDTVFKFDDVGCLVFWLEEKRDRFPWMDDPSTRMWVADYNSKSRDEMTWHDPRQVRYITRTSPMGYNYGAAGGMSDGESVTYEEMRQQTLAKGR
ncbi:hypothetical protein ACUH78_06930 [Thauera sp. ZXT1-4]|jgi:nitrous oxide reductase accessory protein NosL|uniref:hypothetical protein n=1 Tax=Thauera sp. ZXT1-4 TaxID=3460294 RepID=UPI00404085E4